MLSIFYLEAKSLEAKKRSKILIYRKIIAKS
jgi:hypothetical protein